MSGHPGEVAMRGTTHQCNKAGEMFLQQIFQLFEIHQIIEIHVVTYSLFLADSSMTDN